MAVEHITRRNRLLQTSAEGKDVVVYLLALCTAAVATALFVSAFFPAKRGIEEWTGPEELDQSSPASPGKERIIVMLIDAMRADFLYQKGSRFRFINRKIRDGGALAYITKAHPPTVTLPRLKAMIGGSIPGFLDVVSNLNSPELEEDNVITRAVAAGKKVTMFGDETWLRLFPNSFIRSDGTTAFFVLDTEIVDSNVTRHVMPELEEQDWDLMILHYLGLDHAGHLGGVATEQMAGKQLEMDALVESIHVKLQQQSLDSALRPTMLLVCSDHGMTDQGNHAGASDAERDAVAVFFTDFVQPSAATMRQEAASEEEGGSGEPFATVWQVDVAPTLALLLGLAVPTPNIGRAMPNTLDHLQASLYLDALERNAWQLRQRLGREKGEALGAMWGAAVAAKRRCSAALRGAPAEDVPVYRLRGRAAGAEGSCLEQAEEELESFFEAACAELEAEQGAEYDVPLLGLALALMAIAVLVSLLLCLHSVLPVRRAAGDGGSESAGGGAEDWGSGRRMGVWAAGGGVMGGLALLGGCGAAMGGGQGMCGGEKRALLLAGGCLAGCCCSVVAASAGAVAKRVAEQLRPALSTQRGSGWGERPAVEVVVAVGGSVVHLLSLGGSSAVEEEQETFYFLSAPRSPRVTLRPNQPGLPQASACGLQRRAAARADGGAAGRRRWPRACCGAPSPPPRPRARHSPPRRSR